MFVSDGETAIRKEMIPSLGRKVGQEICEASELNYLLRFASSSAYTKRVIFTFNAAWERVGSRVFKCYCGEFVCVYSAVLLIVPRLTRGSYGRVNGAESRKEPVRRKIRKMFNECFPSNLLIVHENALYLPSQHLTNMTIWLSPFDMNSCNQCNHVISSIREGQSKCSASLSEFLP